MNDDIRASEHWGRKVHLTRRQALVGTGVGALTAVLAACGGAPEQMSTPGDTDESQATTTAKEWYEEVPRESWSQFEKVETTDSWFSVYKLPGDVYAIVEDGQWEEAISYLIIGEVRVVLLDTGMGISSIKATVEELTDLPVTVVLSHTHHDHMGGMHEFDELLVFDSEYAIRRATSGLDEFADISVEVSEEAGALDPDRELPSGFSPEGFHVIGKAPTSTLRDGDAIDLGGRVLTVMYTPGHTADGITLFDEKNSLVFTGDTYYPSALYAFSADADLTTYAATMHALSDRAESLGIEWIYPGHNEVVHGVGVLSSAADDLDAILEGTDISFEIDEDGYRVYCFDDGVEIITEDTDYARHE